VEADNHHNQIIKQIKKIPNIIVKTVEADNHHNQIIKQIKKIPNIIVKTVEFQEN
jgi:uncharacterized pyridoxamine 5'-phosphate oxidase family protein